MAQPRSEFPSAPSFILRTLLCAFFGAWAFFTVRVLAGLYMPTVGAWFVAALVVIVPAYLINRRVTGAFRRIHMPDAPAWRSFGGALAVVSLPLLIMLAAGGAGMPGEVAVEEGLRTIAAPVGFSPKGAGSAFDCYPRSCFDGRRFYAPTVGSGDSKRVIVRQSDGTLKAPYVPAPGRTINGMQPARVGYHSPRQHRVRLHLLERQQAELPSSVVIGNGDGKPSSVVIGSGDGKPSIAITGPTGSLVIW